MNVQFNVLSSLQAFHARVRFVTSLSHQYVARLLSTLEHDLPELEYVTDAWRSLCRSAVNLIYEMDAVIRAQQRVEAPFDLEGVIPLLSAAAVGEWPCVEDGRMIMPEWAERRGHERIPLDIGAMLITATSHVSVRVNDISRGGLGLDDVPELPIGSPVVVELENGRSLNGKIQWLNDGRCGIMFSQILAPRDPLLTS